MATKSWIGQAVDVADVWTYTPAGTIAAGSTFAFTINNKTVTYTATGTTVASVTAGIVAFWNSTDNPLPPEFQEAEAVDETTLVRITGRTAGNPLVITQATGGSGSPTATLTNVTAATGRNWVNNADNYTDGAAPANSDVIVLDRGDVDILHGLATSLTGITIDWREGYTGNVGLPPINETAEPYGEYRERYLTLDGATLIRIESSGAQRCNINTGTTAATVIIRQTGGRLNQQIPVVCLRGSHANNTLNVSRGDVGVAFFAGETARFDDLRMAYVDNPATDARVVCGSGCTLATIAKSGGELTINSNVTTFTQGPNGGLTTVQAGAVTTANVDGGTLIYNSTGTLGTAHVSSDGFLDFDQDPRGKTVTNPVEINGATARLRDTRKVVSSLVVDLNRTSDLSRLELGDNLRLTRGSVS